MVTSQNAPIHHRGDHQSCDVVHIIAAVGCFVCPVVHLGQTKPPFFHKASLLGSLVFIRPAVLPVLLPTPMVCWVKGEPLGFSLAAGITAGVQLALLADCTHEGLTPRMLIALRLQGGSVWTVNLPLGGMPHQTVGTVPSIARLGVVATGAVSNTTLTVEAGIQNRVVASAVDG